MKNQYHSKDIVVLKGLEPIRKRPGMYIGNVEDGSGLLHMVFEVLDNSVDESIAGYCSEIKVSLHKDNRITVIDNGRGIPTAWHDVSKMPTPQVVLTTIHSGGKFDAKSYAVSGGLHGVGLCAVNALSEHLVIKISRDGHVYRQEYNFGKPKKHRYLDANSVWQGTEISFLADKNVFGDINFNKSNIEDKVREVAYLNPNLKLVFYDEKSDTKKEFCYSKGLESYLQYLLQHSKKEPFTDSVYLEHKKDNEKVSVSLVYTKSLDTQILSYTNNIKQVDGGSHVTGLRTAISKAVLRYIREDSEYKKQLSGLDIIPEDTRTGLLGLVSVHSSNPSFSSQTKEKLVSSAIRQFVDQCIGDKMYELLVENNALAEKIVERVLLAQKAREASLKHRDAHKQLVDKGLLVSSLVGKLCSCKSKDPAQSELFIVEGESAGGTARGARDRNYQAVLPLKGKIMNVLKAEKNQAFNSVEIVNLIKSLECGVEDACDISKCRYQKIVIMADADPDGKHICTLALTVMYKYLRPLIEAGFVYICYPPLFSFKEQGEHIYFHNQAQLDEKLVKLLHSSLTITHTTEEKHFSTAKTLKALKYYLQYKDAIEAHQANDCHPVLARLIVHSMLKSNNLEKVVEYVMLELKDDLTYQYFFTLSADQKTFSWVQEGRIVNLDLEKFISSKAYSVLIKAYKPLASLGPLSGGTYNLSWGRFSIDAEKLYHSIEQTFEILRKHKQLKRYKGLGEMNYDQLWSSSMDPKQRTLVRVNIEDAARAAETMEILMGQDVAPRKAFIVEQAGNIEFDIM